MRYSKKEKRRIVGELVDHLAAGGFLTGFCERADYPNRKTIASWFADESAQDLRNMLEVGEVLRADLWFEEIITLADDAMVAAHGECPKIGRVIIEAQKLRIDARRWCCARANRAKYGNYKALEAKVEMPTVPVLGIDRPPETTREEWLRRVAKELGRDDVLAQLEQGAQAVDGGE